jgi:hypothetical protein
MSMNFSLQVWRIGRPLTSCVQGSALMSWANPQYTIGSTVLFNFTLHPNEL